jgi:hypothetical protein
MLKNKIAKQMEIIAIILPSETIFSYELKSYFAFGIPVSVSAGGLAMDVTRSINIVKPLDGENKKKVQFVMWYLIKKGYVDVTLSSKFFLLSILGIIPIPFMILLFEFYTKKVSEKIEELAKMEEIKS